MIKEKVLSIVNEAKKINKLLIEPRNINIIFISNLIGILISLILLVSGLAINTEKITKLAIAITGIVLLCLFVLFFYFIEFFRRRTNYHFNQCLDLKFICENLTLRTNVVDVSNFKRVINDYIESIAIETYFANDMNVLNIITNSNDFNVGYFVTDEIENKKMNKHLLLFLNLNNSKIECDQDFIIAKDEALIKRNFDHIHNLKDFVLLSDDKLDQSTINQLQKLITKMNPYIIVKKHNELNIFFKKSINYLLVAKKNYSFWKRFNYYLDQEFTNDFNEFKNIIESL